MPIYEYICEKCGAQFEDIVSASATTCPPCPKCASGDTKKLMSTCRTRTGGGQT
ncbi:MAG TPA: zinc ribbon domain-containing protein, partial [Solidesulfovibrio sp.]|nr:FmdB family transcriptional regulator [Desulfovibrio sp.]HML62543.1 zinc ribbon domain-containing protein [Solidesulfovibrio sp.]